MFHYGKQIHFVRIHTSKDWPVYERICKLQNPANSLRKITVQQSTNYLPVVTHIPAA